MSNYNEESRVAKVNKVLAEKQVELLDKYTNARDHLHFRCLKCNTKFIKVYGLLSVQEEPCPECTVRAKAQRHRDKVAPKMDAFLHEKVLDTDFQIIEYPELMSYPATFKHLVCGNSIHTSIQNLARTTKGMKGIGTGCEYCSGTHTYTEGEIEAYLAKERPNYTLDHVYMSKEHHLMMNVTHNICGEERDFQVNYFIRGEGCKFCPISGGAETIKYELDKLGVEYETEKSFEGLGLKRYDFYIESKNLLIEYDGKQHTQAVESWGGLEGLTQQKEYDNEKNVYAVKNEYNLFRIPFTLRGSKLMDVIEKIVVDEEYSEYLIK